MALPEWWKSDKSYKIVDAMTGLKELPDECVDMMFATPPYWEPGLGKPGLIGSELSEFEYARNLRPVLAEMRRVTKPDGTLWLPMGDMRRLAAGTHLVKVVDHVVSEAHMEDWYLREEVVWSLRSYENGGFLKPRPGDLFQHIHDFVFVFSKARGDDFYLSPKNYSTVWEPRDGCNEDIAKLSGYMTLPRDLADRAILAGSRPGAVILNPFVGSGVTIEQGLRHGRVSLGFDINPAVAHIIDARVLAVEMGR
jgi:DNA modification methylase